MYFFGVEMGNWTTRDIFSSVGVGHWTTRDIFLVVVVGGEAINHLGYFFGVEMGNWTTRDIFLLLEWVTGPPGIFIRCWGGSLDHQGYVSGVGPSGEFFWCLGGPMDHQGYFIRVGGQLDHQGYFSDAEVGHWATREMFMVLCWDTGPPGIFRYSLGVSYLKYDAIFLEPIVGPLFSV